MPLEPVERLGQLHQVSFNLAALNAIAARLADLGIAPGSFKWEPRTLPDGSVEGPYPGLAAFGEGDAGIFFGREAAILAGLTRLRLMRKRGSPRLLVILGLPGLIKAMRA